MDISNLLNDVMQIQGINCDSYFHCSDLKTIKIFARTKRRHSSCQKCGFPGLHSHSWRAKTIQIPPICVFAEVYLQIQYERFKCPLCGNVQSEKVKGVHQKFKKFSTSFVETAGRLMEETTCAASSRLLACNAKTLWSMDNSRTKLLKKEFKLPKDLDVSRLSADEVHFRTHKVTNRTNSFSPRWDIRFITNLVATKHAKIIANHRARNDLSLRNCLRVLTREQLSKVEFFALDMHPGFMRVAKQMCPNANICVDRFHLAQKLNEAFDSVRKNELWKAKKINDSFQQVMLSPGRRFMYLERNPNLSIDEENMLGKLKLINTQIHNSMLIVDYFHKVLDEKFIGPFRSRLAQWYLLVRESKNKHMLGFARLVRKYRINIENYIKSNLTTAVSEGLNNKIRVLKAMAYDYSNEESYMNKILQRCGFLNSRCMDTTPLYSNSDFGTEPAHH
jgi:transposase